MPFRVTGTEGRFNAMIKVEGGGVTGQAGAIRHGIARALLEVDPEGNRLAAAPGRPPHPRSADEGAQEVRPQAGPQGAAVHQALDAPAPERPGVRCRLRPLAHAPSGALAHVLAAAFAYAVDAARRIQAQTDAAVARDGRLRSIGSRTG